VIPTSLPELVVVVGPTASGKTELSLRIAEVLGGEIVNADSVQVYQRFDIGSAKPNAEQLARARHHLIDVLNPNEPLDAASWCEMAHTVIADINARGRLPIVSGGTFLWVKALLFGLADAPPADPKLRAEHRALAEAEGRAALHAKLALVDPTSAQRLNANDFVRVSRALEVYELTGEALSALQAQHGFKAPNYRAQLCGVARAREELDERILQRTHTMFQAGWIDEVRRLIHDGFSECRAMGSVGYRQIAAALEAPGAIDTNELELSVFRATRVFARRQRTWLREQVVTWLTPSALEEGDDTLKANLISCKTA
jgi:tRNA dimethylallyltransferase